MASLQALLAQHSRDAQKKGDEFEALVKWFLENEPGYKALLKKVYRWNSSPHRWGRDTGIDLTAEGHDGRLWGNPGEGIRFRLLRLEARRGQVPQRGR